MENEKTTTTTATDNSERIAKVKQDLAHFYGTERYYQHLTPFGLKFNYTDGVRYVAKELGAYWMLDIIASYQISNEVSGEEFQVFKFVKHDNDSMTLTISNGNEKVLATQEIEFTDFLLDEMTFWFLNGVAILPSEY